MSFSRIMMFRQLSAAVVCCCPLSYHWAFEHRYDNTDNTRLCLFVFRLGDTYFVKIITVNTIQKQNRVFIFVHYQLEDSGATASAGIGK